METSAMRTTTVGLVLSVAASLFTTGLAMAQSPEPSTPPPLLVGVIIPDAGEPMAILEDPQTHEQTIHALGAQIGDVRLTKILRDRVVLASGDVVIEVRLAGPASPPPSRAVPSRPSPRRPRLSVPR
jgi:hypothetical protein